MKAHLFARRPRPQPGAAHRSLLAVLILTMLLVGAIGAQQAVSTDRPDGISKQALWGLMATWLGLGIGFFGVVLTIRRDRATAQKDLRAMQEDVDRRTNEVVALLLNSPDYRERVDARTREVIRDQAYSVFKFDPRRDDRIAALETITNKMRADLENLERRLAARDASLVRDREGTK